MTKVFIGGSRKITRLSAPVRERLDRIIENELAVLVGDANGADRAVQRHLSGRGYMRVEVFCTNGECRNNLGEWVTRAVSAPRGARGFDYYAVKDEQMARECSVGFMLWDGKSRGTLANVVRLVEKNKKAVIFVVPEKQFVTIRDEQDLRSFLRSGDKQLPKKKKKTDHSLQPVPGTVHPSLF